MADRPIILGVIGRPQGIKGYVRVKAFTQSPKDLAAYGPLLDDRGERWIVEWQGDGIAALRNAETSVLVSDRTTAEKLVNRTLSVLRSQLPQPEEDEFYFSDLIDLDVALTLPIGDEVEGKVKNVHDYGAGASLEVVSVRDQSVYIIPFIKTYVPYIDIPGCKIFAIVPTEIDGEEENKTHQGEV